MVIIIEKLLKLRDGDKMKEEKHIESFIHKFENIMNVGNDLNQLNDELSKKIENQEDNVNLKGDLLNNLIIANNMIDKYDEIIFNDVELRERSKQLFKRLSNLLL